MNIEIANRLVELRRAHGYSPSGSGRSPPRTPTT